MGGGAAGGAGGAAGLRDLACPRFFSFSFSCVAAEIKFNYNFFFRLVPSVFFFFLRF